MCNPFFCPIRSSEVMTLQTYMHSSFIFFRLFYTFDSFCEVYTNTTSSLQCCLIQGSPVFNVAGIFVVGISAVGFSAAWNLRRTEFSPYGFFVRMNFSPYSDFTVQNFHYMELSPYGILVVRNFRRNVSTIIWTKNSILGSFSCVLAYFLANI